MTADPLNVYLAILALSMLVSYLATKCFFRIVDHLRGQEPE